MQRGEPRNFPTTTAVTTDSVIWRIIISRNNNDSGEGAKGSHGTFILHFTTNETKLGHRSRTLKTVRYRFGKCFITRTTTVQFRTRLQNLSTWRGILAILFGHCLPAPVREIVLGEELFLGKGHKGYLCRNTECVSLINLIRDKHFINGREWKLFPGELFAQ